MCVCVVDLMPACVQVCGSACGWSGACLCGIGCGTVCMWLIRCMYVCKWLSVCGWFSACMCASGCDTVCIWLIRCMCVCKWLWHCVCGWFSVCMCASGYNIAQIIWPSLIHTSQSIHTIILDTTPCYWQPMLNCPINSNPDFIQSCLIQTHTQIALHWHLMLNCPFNSNPDLVVMLNSFQSNLAHLC